MRFSEKLLSYFPTPYFLDMPHVGLDITSTSIRFLELIKVPGHLKIGKYGIHPLSNPIVFDASLLGNKELEDALTQIQRTQKITFVEVSIPEVASYLYTTEVPMGDESSIRANIEMHLEENVPLTLTEAIFEYFPIREDHRNSMVTVAVSVVPYQIVRDYTLLLQKSGMTPVSFLIEDQALSRAVVDYDDKDAYLIVQISEKRTVLSIVSDHAVQFTSSIPIGSIDFTESLMREYKISREESEAMKKDPEYEGHIVNTASMAGMLNAPTMGVYNVSKHAVVYLTENF